MTIRNSLFTAGAMAALALATAVSAQVPASRIPMTPGIINYQGRLLTPEGGLYSNGVYNIEFRIYESDTAVSTGLWGCAYPVYVKDSYFNVMLGAPGGAPVNPAPAYAPLELWRALWYDANNPGTASDRYLGLKVLNGPDPALPSPAVEAFPRQRFLSSPFAERAGMAQYARAAHSTFTVGTTLTVTGQVSALGGLSVQGSATLPATTVNGAMTLNQGVTVNNQQGFFARGLTVSGLTAYVKSGLDVVGSAIFRGGVNAAGGKIQEGGNDLIPRGVIVMWHGSTAPQGWALCDGQNGTPDLRGRFVLASGQGNNLTGRSWTQTGGAETHILQPGEMPSHNHYTTFAHNGWPDGSGDRDNNNYIMHPSRGANANFYTSSSGGGAAHNNMPPFYVLAYIMKL